MKNGIPDKYINWVLFWTLTCLWASAYAFTRLAVSRDAPAHGFPPELVICGRLTLGAFLLLIIARLSGQAWPALTDWRSWMAMALMGVLGTAAPFYVITTAQQTVNSSLAALYVAAAPLFVALLAHFAFTDDRLSRRKGLGLLIGFCGVGVLLGPDALNMAEQAGLVAQLLCLLGTAFYAVATIIARLARHIPPFVFAAGYVGFAACAAWPLLLVSDYQALNPSGAAIMGIIGLALGPTATASVLYLILVKRSSATFLSMTGYTIPLVSSLIGFVAFGEMQTPLSILAFGLILCGVFLSRHAPASVQVKA